MSANPRNKMTEEAKAKILKLKKEGLSKSIISQRMNISVSSITNFLSEEAKKVPVQSSESASSCR